MKKKKAEQHPSMHACMPLEVLHLTFAAEADAQAIDAPASSRLFELLLLLLLLMQLALLARQVPRGADLVDAVQLAVLELVEVDAVDGARLSQGLSSPLSSIDMSPSLPRLVRGKGGAEGEGRDDNAR